MRHARSAALFGAGAGLAVMVSACAGGAAADPTGSHHRSREGIT